MLRRVNLHRVSLDLANDHSHEQSYITVAPASSDVVFVPREVTEMNAIISKALIGATAAFVLGASAASAATIINGGFEAPDAVNQFDTLTGTQLTGWTIGGSIDLIGSYWESAEGDQSIDLNGNGQGSISQMINALVVNATYAITFAIAGNSDSLPTIKTMTVDVGGVPSTYTFDTTGTDVPSPMNWVYRTFTFTATNTSMLLTFASQDAGSWGMALDDVSIAAVPVPAGGLLLLGALGGLAGLRRRKTA